MAPPEGGEPRLVLPETPILAGDPLEVAVVVGEQARYIATATVASFFGPSCGPGTVAEFRLWAEQPEFDPGWGPVEGPWLENHGRVCQPVVFRVPEVLESGAWWLEVPWVREDLLHPPPGKRLFGRARGRIDVVGPTAPDGSIPPPPILALTGAPTPGAHLRCTLIGNVAGRVPRPENWAWLELRTTDGWKAAASLFAGHNGREPHWLPAGEGFFAYGPRAADEQVFRFPNGLAPGDYRLVVRYAAEPLDRVEGPAGLGGAPPGKVWHGLLRRNFRIGDDLR